MIDPAAPAQSGNRFFGSDAQSKEHDPEKWKPVFGEDHPQSK
jgi:hypothetical protein